MRLSAGIGATKVDGTTCILLINPLNVNCSLALKLCKDCSRGQPCLRDMLLLPGLPKSSPFTPDFPYIYAPENRPAECDKIIEENFIASYEAGLLIFLCFLKSDAHGVPIRGVLRSPFGRRVFYLYKERVLP